MSEPPKKDEFSSRSAFEKTLNARSVPSGWTCSEWWYDALDGCDCNCGVWDPDCDVDGQYLYGCPSQDYTCQYNGASPPSCNMPPTHEPTNPPTNEPTNDPTKEPTNAPTNEPTNAPTNEPTTIQPTSKPTSPPTTSHPT